MKKLFGLACLCLLLSSQGWASKIESDEESDQPIYVSCPPESLRAETISLIRKAHENRLDSLTYAEFYSALMDARNSDSPLFSSSVHMKGTHVLKTPKVEKDLNRMVYHPIHGEIAYSDLMKKLGK